MSKLYEKSVSEHYLHGSFLAAIEAALPALGKTTESITVEDLASIDEFHIGGRLATDHLLDQLAFSEQSRLVVWEGRHATLQAAIKPQHQSIGNR